MTHRLGRPPFKQERSCALHSMAVLVLAGLLQSMNFAHVMAEDSRTWHAELSFDPHPQATKWGFQTSNFEFVVDDKGAVIGTAVIGGHGSNLQGVLSGTLAREVMQMSAPLTIANPLPENAADAAQWNAAVHPMLTLSGNMTGRVIEGRGTLNISETSDCVEDCPRVDLAVTWRASGPGTAVGVIEGDPAALVASRKLQEMREQNRAREDAIPAGCRVEILEISGDVDLVPAQQAVAQPPPSPELSQKSVVTPPAGRPATVSLNAGSRAMCATDVIHTGVGAQMTLRLQDGTIVKVGELTQFKPIIKPPQDKDEAFRNRAWLKAGQISVEATHGSKPRQESSWQFRTPTATCTDRGTKFTIRHEGAPPRTTVKVTEGEVAVTPNNPATPVAFARAGAEVQVTATDIAHTGNVTFVQQTSPSDSPPRQGVPPSLGIPPTPLTQPNTKMPATAATFDHPRENGEIVDHCVTWATDCGQPGADQFCRNKGYGSATEFRRYPAGRTYVIGSRQTCEGPHCMGFSKVVCVAGGQGVRN